MGNLTGWLIAAIVLIVALPIALVLGILALALAIAILLLPVAIVALVVILIVRGVKKSKNKAAVSDETVPETEEN